MRLATIPAEYKEFLLRKLTRIDGVNSVQSSFVLRKAVDKTVSPLREM
jgi:Lrp/AsnC family leucine-responsive transcriptional regulator